MPKFSGAVGYSKQVESSPGVWTPETIEREYYGDLIHNARQLQNANKINDDLNINNQLSIVADPYARDHFHEMLYAKFNGIAWKITNVEVQYPRLILTLGGCWNG